jgi:prepilin-type N-terminal cleavage/methylation domain-containing protein
VNKRETKSRARRGGDRSRGFSLIELCVTVALGLVIAGIAVVQAQPALRQINANNAKSQVQAMLRQARETAVSDRRDVQVEFLVNPAGFPPGSYVRLTRIGGACCANTVILMAPVPNSVIFTTFNGEPDTPDAFGNGGPIFFGGLNGGPPAGMIYQSDGTFVINGVGTPINGTVFMGIPNQPTTARAITILGATGRVRAYHISGTTTWFDD